MFSPWMMTTNFLIMIASVGGLFYTVYLNEYKVVKKPVLVRANPVCEGCSLSSCGACTAS